MYVQTLPEVTTKSTRIVAVDLLRGVIMVIMALDHTRDYFSNAAFDPLDIAQTTPFYYFTRWITHLCAPNFVFLAGVGAYMMTMAGKSKEQLSFFLFTRGLWLVLLEFTVVRLGWTFNLDYEFSVAQVIWVIGMSMVFLSALIFFPVRWIGFIGIGMIVLHNLLDGFTAKDFGDTGWLWKVVHERGFIPFNQHYGLLALYPLIPWIGVMTAGYAFGSFYKQDVIKRKQWFFSIGCGTILGFFILRYLNFYGDLLPWVQQKNSLLTFLSFMNVEKYPPSLLFLMITIGIGILLLALFENSMGKLTSFFIVYGRVPLFYYVLHIYLIHIIAVLAAWITINRVDFLFSSDLFTGTKHGYGFNLLIVYLFWVLVILLLYYPCKWFMNVKKHSGKWWISYL
ncbi:DUF1624 domain-containing protein [Solitalea lacus]|uniref:DUF1624 domain-containing protein n=1 Tax=Solitalea lacus TaxID=2911172 RepID=UPI001EDB6AB3|nr:heparan-alpha-glucosaminide N-acetyltransferase domain-containing protein [Solitalea lacus]UKJ09149.1 heparan-alpha-glucosaminide N-acetyltransferase domain-containing protein [Solitalea lacus]